MKWYDVWDLFKNNPVWRAMSWSRWGTGEAIWTWVDKGWNQVVFFFKRTILHGLIFIYFYFWLCWVPTLVSASRGYSSLWCMGFSLRWFPLLQIMGSRHTGFSSCGIQALVAPWHVGSFCTRDETFVPCVGRWTPNQETTREAHISLLLRRKIWKLCNLSPPRTNCMAFWCQPPTWYCHQTGCSLRTGTISGAILCPQDPRQSLS